MSGTSSGLRLGAIVGLVLALWSASAGVKNLMTAVNRAYHETETRGFFKLRATALLLTIGMVVLGGIALFGLIIAPQAMSSEGGVGVARDVLMIVRWPLAALVMIAGLAVLYRFAPTGTPPLGLGVARRDRRHDHVARRPRPASRSTPPTSASTTRPTGPWAPSSS